MQPEQQGWGRNINNAVAWEGTTDGVCVPCPLHSLSPASRLWDLLLTLAAGRRRQKEDLCQVASLVCAQDVGGEQEAAVSGKVLVGFF